MNTSGLTLLSEEQIDQLWLETKKIQQLIFDENTEKATEHLIKLLDNLKGFKYPTVVNHYIRQLGLYPYMQTDTASFEDRYVYSLFQTPITPKETHPLHKDQSLLLKQLLEGKNLAVSAPTSSGKSFVIDALIYIKKLQNIVIIVPTIALMDEARRRLQRNFGHEYNIITSSDEPLSEKNILIFPQERALHYTDKLENIDLLVVDEFYKVSEEFNKGRSDDLMLAIIRFRQKGVKQFYFLAPNIDKIDFKDFKKLIPSLEFLKLKTQTVFLDIKHYYQNIHGDYEKKQKMIELYTKELKGKKTLIYAGSVPQILEVSNTLIEYAVNNSEVLTDFSRWVEANYGECLLSQLAYKGMGIHNGKQHRPLSQMQLHLFSLENGIQTIISTSSIIEGVNTAAENIVLWNRRNGKPNLTFFDYKNLIGRGGRMFKYFIGNIYLLVQPIEEKESTLELPFSDGVQAQSVELCKALDISSDKLQEDQQKLKKLIGEEKFKIVETEHNHLLGNIERLIKLIEITQNPTKPWDKRLKTLNININSKYWHQALHDILQLKMVSFGVRYNHAVELIKIIPNNWQLTPNIIRQKSSESGFPLTMEQLFEFEKKLTFDFSMLIQDINTIFQIFAPNKLNLIPFATYVSHAFLPRNVYLLEEYGLPRMILRKIHDSELINLDENISLSECIKNFKEIGFETLCSEVSTLDKFDKYFLKYFFDGI